MSTRHRSRTGIGLVHKPRSRRLAPYLLVALGILAVIITNLIPIGATIWQSFRRNSATTPGNGFYGVSNYFKVLTDSSFVGAFVNTLGYVLIAIAGVLTLGFGAALWLKRIRRSKALLLTLIIIPWAVPGTVNGEMWSLIYNSSNGFLNKLLKGFNLLDTNVHWLHGNFALPLVGLTLLWQALPIGALVLLSGLENIPAELYEQSAIDGADGVRAFGRITVPLMRPVIAITIVQTAFTAVNFFDQIYVLNGNAPETLSIVQQTYIYAFKSLDFGLAYSTSMLTTILTLLICLIAVKFVYREVEL